MSESTLVNGFSLGDRLIAHGDNPYLLERKLLRKGSIDRWLCIAEPGSVRDGRSAVNRMRRQRSIESAVRAALDGVQARAQVNRSLGNSTFRLKPDFVKDLAEWYSDHQATTLLANEDWAKRHPRETPTPEARQPFSKRRVMKHIRSLLEESFWASLRTEEGRLHNFALVYAPQGDDVSGPFEGSTLREKRSCDMPWGTRHQSAAQFIFDNKDALAIVASHDGKLSVFMWDDANQAVSVTEEAEFLLL